MRRFLGNALSVAITFFRFLLMKIYLGKNFKYGMIERFSPNVVTEFNRNSFVRLSNRVRVHSGTKIKVRRDAVLHIGADVKINYNCIIACRNRICIGDGTEFGPSVYLYDHDHDYRKGLSAKSDEERFLEDPIEIGKNCWIGANTVILRGTTIGDNCVVGAGCVLKGSYGNGSVIMQKRNTTVTRVDDDRE